MADRVDSQQDPKSTGTKDTSETSSMSAEAETSKRVAIDAKNILKEKKAWRERNKRLVGSLHKGNAQIGSKEAEEEVDGITSKFRDLVTGELRRV
ncbi:hypothetical protein L3X38_023653 [Prunus dulcis]|uniref:Uncharacterized protein n=1 Tax=Prunus dulcis TaxID=3755 RepID=A0AAD4W081_PRUDU|nr:hypothetical protein L3X38_023653 [Prunus dulcis]